MKGEVWTVPEWFFDKVNDACKNYGCMLSGEYTEQGGITMLDHTKLRVDEMICESEKAYKVRVEAETRGGEYKGWTTWVPKSVVTR